MVNELGVGRDAVATLVRLALDLSSDREANHIVNVVTDSIVAVVKANIDTDGFTLKLPGFGKFTVRHKQGRMRMIRLTGKIQMSANKRKVKFTPLSEFRGLEPMPKRVQREARALATPAE